MHRYYNTTGSAVSLNLKFELNEFFNVVHYCAYLGFSSLFTLNSRLIIHFHIFLRDIIYIHFKFKKSCHYYGSMVYRRCTPIASNLIESLKLFAHNNMCSK